MDDVFSDEAIVSWLQSKVDSHECSLSVFVARGGRTELRDVCAHWYRHPQQNDDIRSAISSIMRQEAGHETYR